MPDTSSGQIAAEVISQQKGVSLWELFWGAEFVVQVIILLLLLASFLCWAIIFSKYSYLKKMRRKSEKFEQMFWQASSLDGLASNLNKQGTEPLTRLFLIAMEEWKTFKKSFSRPSITDLQFFDQRLNRSLGAYLRTQVDRLQKNLTFLATVGSTAPFVGLFGTVWGIMHSFQSIAVSKNTSIAVVAPGIAEALFATALGLIAAIPAVMAYNKLSAMVNGYSLILDNFVDDISAVLQQQEIESAKVA